MPRLLLLIHNLLLNSCLVVLLASASAVVTATVAVVRCCCCCRCRRLGFRCCTEYCNCFVSCRFFVFAVISFRCHHHLLVGGCFLLLFAKAMLSSASLSSPSSFCVVCYSTRGLHSMS